MLASLILSCSLLSLLKDKPNFRFEFRGSIEFKNVPEPVKCYFLLDNTEKEEYTPIVISDEPEQVSFQFMMSRSSDTPPATPHSCKTTIPASTAMAQMLSLSNSRVESTSCPMFGPVPDLNVIKPTPTSTPLPSPPPHCDSGVIEFSVTEPCPPYSHRGDYDSDSTVSPPNGTTIPHDSPEESDQDMQRLSESHHQSSFMVSMRNTSMSPLREDLNEEDVISFSVKEDEGIEVQRKTSDTSNYSTESGGGTDPIPEETKNPTRKTSDVSSGESGIDTSTGKISDSSKNDVPSDREKIRKLSNSSSGSTEEELASIRRNRAGSVSRTIEKYDSFSRQRKTGFSAVIYRKDGTQNGEDETGAQADKSPPPD